ncbi:BRCA1-associated protein 2-domain-containing protein [Lactarius hengduanensis]|nr:BRCA1-associated protein 2-domain-containing protein [Lactarius hengduanensis]
MRAYHVRIVLHLPPSKSKKTDAFIPLSLWQPLPTHTFKSTARRNATFNPRGKDYRLGPIALDWVDLDNMAATPSASRGRADPKGPAVATFVPQGHTKSGSTNLPDGVVHVFRDSERQKLAEAEEGTSAADTSRIMLENADSDGYMVGVLAVPSWMTPSDFLAFVAPAQEDMSHLRMVRDTAPNRSIALIKFRKPESALEFAEAYNGKTFNSMNAETCHVVHISSVSIETDDSVSMALSRLGSATAPVFELPTCPVCLERMDSAVTGLVTVPCSHTFHCECLSKWGDSRCPVCRYSQTLRTSHPSSSSAVRSTSIPFADPSAPALSSCADCDSTTSLWICLICGNIGCGRYGRAHAHAHYERTTHLYALELETQRVWDYAGDGYVHRLIQNVADGKLVELPSASMRTGDDTGAGGPSTSDSLTAEKIEAIGIEYSYLLTSQLDSQRAFYEEQTTALQAEVVDLKVAVTQLRQEAESSRAAAAAEESRRRGEEEERLSEILRDKQRFEKKSERFAEVARTLEKELREERAVSGGLLQNLEAVQKRAEEGEAERVALAQRVQELEDQVRDVMFFLEARTKIEAGEGSMADVAGGDISVPTPQPSPGPSAKTPGKKKKKKR